LIRRFIKLSPASPIPSPDNPDDPVSIGEPNGQYEILNQTEAVKTFLGNAVQLVRRYNAGGIYECQLSDGERNAMLALVLGVLDRVPLE
jgi:hypothetical protein